MAAMPVFAQEETEGRTLTLYDEVVFYDGYNETVFDADLGDLNASLGIPGSLSELGVTPDKFDAMADDAMKSGNIAVNPRTTTRKDVLALYREAL